MSKSTKLACGLLACGLTFSLAAPVFAEEEAPVPAVTAETPAPEAKEITETAPETTEETPQAQLKTAAVAAVQKNRRILC